MTSALMAQAASESAKIPDKTQSSALHISETEDSGKSDHIQDSANSEQCPAKETGASGAAQTSTSSEHHPLPETRTSASVDADTATCSEQRFVPETSAGSDAQITDMDVDPVAFDVGAEISTGSEHDPIPETSANGNSQITDMDVDPAASNVRACESPISGLAMVVDSNINLDLTSDVDTPNAAPSGTPGGTSGGKDSTLGQPVAPAVINAPVWKPAPIKYINGMSEYEWHKAENIKKNQKLLTTLGLDDVGKKLFGKENMAPSKSKRKNPGKPPKANVAKQTLRSSGKNRSEYVMAHIGWLLIYLQQYCKYRGCRVTDSFVC
jgi:hypothetical protein